jgi:CheY-like chemotaxis protein
MSSAQPPDPESGTDPQPGHRSGLGAASLWIHLAQDAQRKAIAGQGKPATVPDRSLFKVLVVDDSEAARYAMARVLRAAGYKTIEAASGAEALVLAEAVSALVLDVHLPDLHGFEVCRILRSRRNTAAMPIIHVSGVYVESSHKETASSAGADAYLVAPVPALDLVDTVDSLLARGA